MAKKMTPAQRAETRKVLSTSTVLKELTRAVNDRQHDLEQRAQTARMALTRARERLADAQQSVASSYGANEQWRAKYLIPFKSEAQEATERLQALEEDLVEVRKQLESAFADSSAAGRFADRLVKESGDYRKEIDSVVDAGVSSFVRHSAAPASNAWRP